VDDCKKDHFKLSRNNVFILGEISPLGHTKNDNANPAKELF
jgi:hypothetical protein